MLKSKPAQGAKVLQCACQGETHLNALHSVLPWTLSFSRCPPLPRNCWNRINPPPTGINLLFSFLSSRAHIENLDKWTGCKLPTRTADCTSKLSYFHRPHGGGNWDRPWSSASQSQLKARPKHVSQPLKVRGWLSYLDWARSCTLPSLPLFNQQTQRRDPMASCCRYDERGSPLFRPKVV